MIIGDALGRVFEGKAVKVNLDGKPEMTRAVQYHYGNQKELIKWVRSKGNEAKYPLIWWAISPVISESTSGKEVKGQLIILTDTKLEWLNNTKMVKTYNTIVEPVYNLIVDTLDAHPYVQVLGDLSKKYPYKDEPSFGIEQSTTRLGQTEFAKTQEKSVTLDIVDGRIINIHFKIKPNCI